MCHVEEEVVLLELERVTVVLMLCLTLGANEDDAMVLHAYIASGRLTGFLYQYQVVAPVHTVGVGTTQRLYSGYAVRPCIFGFYSHSIVPVGFGVRS